MTRFTTALSKLVFLMADVLHPLNKISGVLFSRDLDSNVCLSLLLVFIHFCDIFNEAEGNQERHLI